MQETFVLFVKGECSYKHWYGLVLLTPKFSRSFPDPIDVSLRQL